MKLTLISLGHRQEIRSRHLEVQSLQEDRRWWRLDTLHCPRTHCQGYRYSSEKIERGGQPGEGPVKKLSLESCRSFQDGEREHSAISKLIMSHYFIPCWLLMVVR